MPITSGLPIGPKFLCDQAVKFQFSTGPFEVTFVHPTDLTRNG
jgi:hypothetical protein